MKTDNLKFRTDLQDLVIEKYGWLFCNTLYDCLQRQIAQKFLKSKIETLPVSSNSFYVVENAKIEDTCESIPTLIHQHVPCYDAS